VTGQGVGLLSCLNTLLFGKVIGVNKYSDDLSSLMLKISLDPGNDSGLYNARMMMKRAGKEFLRAGELAKTCHVSTDTLRHYERKGVLARPRRSANGYREYPADAVERVRLIRKALDVGFTLDELASILSVRDRGGAPCRRVRELAAAKLYELEQRLKEMLGLRDELRTTLRDWDEKLAGAGSDRRAGLLESLVIHTEGSKAQSHARPLRLKRNRRKREIRDEK
jgi:DNA-binding transcriptional MerR regulator